MVNKVLLVGTLPPPIGGVSIHIKRLLSYLNGKKSDFHFFDYKREGLLTFIKQASYSKVVHLNFTNHWALFVFTVISFLLRKRVLYTIHGNILNRSSVNKLIIKYLIPFIDCLIVVNETSKKYLEEYTDKVRLMPAFIAPRSDSNLPADLIQEIVELKKNTRLLLSTNANSVSYDSNGEEVYGIKELINEVKSHSDIGLVISNAAGDYIKEVGSLPKNIRILSKPHDFTGVLKHSDVFIRNTTTDGDSLSIKEAISLGVPVIATNVIERHKECYLYNLHDMNKLFSLIDKNNGKYSKNIQLEEFTDSIISVYQSF